MGGGPPDFPQGSTCLVVLWIPPGPLRFRLRGSHPLWPAFPKPFPYRSGSFLRSITPARTRAGLGSFPFARRYSGNRCFFLFLRVLRCFSSPGSPRTSMNSMHDTATLLAVSFLIRKSTDRSLFTTPRSLSQLVTSFIGAWCQGIHRMPLLALIIYV